MTDFEIYDLKLVYFNLFCYYTFQLFVDPIWKPTKVGVWIITAFTAEVLQNGIAMQCMGRISEHARTLEMREKHGKTIQLLQSFSSMP